MLSRETRFQANLAKKRRRTLGAALVCVAIGYFRDTQSGSGFPSAITVVSSIIIVLGIELHFQLHGARALSISPSGITLERWFGSKNLRLSWGDLDRVEVRKPATGPVWTFLTKNGEKIRWLQVGFDGDKRIELEKALGEALRQRGIRVDGTGAR